MNDRLFNIVLSVALLFMFYLNVKLFINLRDLSKVKEEYLLFTLADSMESNALQITNLPKANKSLIFIVNPKTCNTCIIRAIDRLVKNYRSLLDYNDFQILLLSDRIIPELLGFIERNGYKSISFALATVKFSLPRKIDALCLFTDKRKVIYAYALNSVSYKNLDLFYGKISRYIGIGGN